jgi:outer membrane protein assembly factor BamB
MRGHDDDAAAKLSRYWNSTGEQDQAVPPGLDPTFVETIDRIGALDTTPDPDPAFIARLETHLLRRHGAASGPDHPLVLPLSPATMPNGHVTELDSPEPAPPIKRLWPVVEALAAVLLIAVLAGTALGGGQSLTWLRDRFSGRTERNVDVPMYRGDAARTGVMPGPVPKQPPVELWRATLPGASASVAQSAPLVAGDLVVVAQPNGVVVAFDRTSGVQRWLWQPSRSLRLSAAPAIAGGLVFAGAQDGTFVALDLAIGTEVWRVNLGATVGAPAVVKGTVYVGLGSDPAVAGGLVYVVGGCSCTTVVALDTQTGVERWRFKNADPFLFALDARSGEERWRYDVGDATLAAPSVAGGTVYTVSSTGSVLAIDAETGEQRWQQDIGGTSYATGFGATPAVKDKIVFVSGRNRTVTALDAVTGTIRWQRDLGGALIASPTVTADTVYVGDLNGMLTALDEDDGAVRWSFKFSALIGGPITVTDGVVYALTGDGALTSLADAA